MSCCPEYGTGGSVRQLIHELSAPWIDPDKPVTFGTYDCAGEWAQCTVTGVTARDGAVVLQFEADYE